ncbi:MAG TPA: ectoine/hydroxyectoine ABC transporter substrate-binding protein EhuB [Gammaproteobacteria bacterium]|nr:ectoine/hydroxyectoine ABC transporter substrate-binding protein EhuB [Gammaproteobacteria bacterium]
MDEGRRRTLRLLAGGLGAGALTLSGCSRSGESDAGKGTLAQMKDAGTARIGYANEAPYAFLDVQTNELTGEAPEIARVILQRMGIPTIDGVLTEFGALIPGLKAKRFDIIAAGMYILPQRCQQIAFSNPTYGIGEAFIVKAGNPEDLHSFADVAHDAGATLGVVTGAVERRYAKKTGIPDDRVKVFPDAASALAGVESGRVDAYAGSSLTMRDLLNKAGKADVALAAPFTDPVIDGKSVRGYGAFGFRKTDRELLEQFNKELANFIGTPEHLKLVTPFGFTREDLPGNVTAAQLCKG